MTQPSNPGSASAGQQLGGCSHFILASQHSEGHDVMEHTLAVQWSTIDVQTWCLLDKVATTMSRDRPQLLSKIKKQGAVQCSFWCFGKLLVHLRVLLGLRHHPPCILLRDLFLDQVTRSRKMYACVPPTQAVRGPSWLLCFVAFPIALKYPSPSLSRGSYCSCGP